MDGPSPDPRRTWITRRKLLGGLAGVCAVSFSSVRVMGQAGTPAALPLGGSGNKGTGSESAPYQIALFSALPEISIHWLRTIAAALNTQIKRDFAPVWGIHGTVTALHKGEPTPTGHWPIEIMDLGPNLVGLTITDSGHFPHHPRYCKGFPQAYVLYDANHPRLLAHAASHECLEMLANPFLTTFFKMPSLLPSQGDVQYVQEVCDPCWTIDYSYSADSASDSLLVSDFVTPGYFASNPIPVPGVRYSFTGSVTGPLGIALGCNQQWVELDMQQWWQGEQTTQGVVVSSIITTPSDCP